MSPILYKALFTKQECEQCLKVIPISDRNKIRSTLNNKNIDGNVAPLQRCIRRRASTDLTTHFFNKVIHRFSQECVWDNRLKCVDVMFVCQYTRECFLGRHRDKDSSAERAYTAITMLVEASNYDGGLLVVEDEPFELDLGDTIILDRECLHEVTPVRSGERVTAVHWFNGFDS